MTEPRLLYGDPRSILITGASSGIGAALAENLARFGGKIALFARRQDRLEAVAEKVAAAGASPLVIAGDVTDPVSVAEGYDRVVEAQGPVDVAFLNAGIGDSFRIQRFTAARVRKTFEVNLFGVVHWLEHLLPSMLDRQSGTIVGISSLAAHLGGPMSGPYSASKAALSVLLESLRVEARRAGVVITTIEPGFIRSELTAKNKFKMPFLVETADAAQKIADAAAAGVPVARFPWPMAAAIRVLKSFPSGLYDRVAGRMLPPDKGSLKQ
ncbi:MAG: SDR family NAD(P)-dependent oxidoreductase [Deltaproteobacteria bacterium]|nr:SDR family NAD(P)-dependent oxidoreductase [Deltaproteobacteria bacterium]